MGGPKMPAPTPPPAPPKTLEDAEKAEAVTEAARSARYKARGLGRRGTIITGMGSSNSTPSKSPTLG